MTPSKALWVAVSVAGCGTTRVEAVVESDQPFLLPGVDERVCLAANSVDTDIDYKAGDRVRIRHPTTFVVAPADARLRVGDTSFPVPVGNDVELAMRESKGWTSRAYVYEWVADDENRMPPPEEVIRIAQRGRRLSYSALLTVVCDGNPACSPGGSQGLERKLERLKWTVDTIPCGQPFQYAGPLPE